MTPDQYYRTQQAITREVLDAAASAWGAPPADFDAWFADNFDRLMSIAMYGQTQAVSGADDYVAELVDVDPNVTPDGTSLVGIASDGRPLDSLLYGAVVRANESVGNGFDERAAWESGWKALALRLQTQTADASRVATGLSITARKGAGYKRHLSPPSCTRCVTLADVTYRYSAGFKRHPGCDCRHVPVRDNGHGILRGPNVRSVVAAGEVRYRGARLMPEAIYDMTDTREEALTLLAAHGYLL